MRPADRCPGRNTWLPKSLWGCFPLSERKRKGRTDLFGSSTNSWYQIFSWKKKFPGQAAKYLVQLENAKEGEDHLCASADRTNPPFSHLGQPWKMTYLTSFNKLLGLYPRLRCCGVHCSAPPPLTWLPFSSPRRAVTAVEKSSGWAAQGGQRRTLNSGFSSGHHQCQSGRRAAWSVRLSLTSSLEEVPRKCWWQCDSSGLQKPVDTNRNPFIWQLAVAIRFHG